MYLLSTCKYIVNTLICAGTDSHTTSEIIRLPDRGNIYSLFIFIFIV